MVTSHSQLSPAGKSTRSPALKILYYEGYIRGFRVTNSKIYVFLKLNNFQSGILDLAFFCPKNKHSHLSYKKLISFYGLKTFGIVSTNSA